MMSFAFDSFSDFLAMGHYGAYVWSTWGISALGLGLLIGHTHSARRQFYRNEALRLRLQKARMQSAKAQSVQPSAPTDGERPS